MNGVYHTDLSNGPILQTLGSHHLERAGGRQAQVIDTSRHLMVYTLIYSVSSGDSSYRVDSETVCQMFLLLPWVMCLSWRVSVVWPN